MKEQFKEIEIPFGAKDSELCGWEYTIPEGMEATIIDNKIVVKKKESEDELIRKDIVFYIAANHKDDGEKARWLYWLEKQGKQELTVIIPKFKAGQTIKYIGDFTIYPEVFTVSKVGEAHYLDKNGFTIPIKNQDQWELVEQKPTDKVEPMFKIEEEKWYVCTQTYVLRGKIVVIKGQTYQAEKDNVIKGEDGCLFIDRHDGKASDYFRYWTIQDAKDGDVLSYRDGQWCFIYKGIVTEDTFKYYALLSEKGITVNDAAFSLLSSCITPATKEQCDILMKEMADAGYTFDFEKKELKKIEQKPAEKTTWYDNMDDLIADAMIDDIKNADMPEHCKHNRLTWINKHRSKSTEWSDEDEEQFSFCCAAIELSNYSSDEYRNYAISFLESLKDRVQPQPKQEWKPSEEQMENLSRAFNGGTFQTSLLMELYQDLKKLMEE